MFNKDAGDGGGEGEGYPRSPRAELVLQPGLATPGAGELLIPVECGSKGVEKNEEHQQSITVDVRIQSVRAGSTLAHVLTAPIAATRRLGRKLLSGHRNRRGNGIRNESSSRCRGGSYWNWLMRLPSDAGQRIGFDMPFAIFAFLTLSVVAFFVCLATSKIITDGYGWPVCLRLRHRGHHSAAFAEISLSNINLTQRTHDKVGGCVFRRFVPRRYFPFSEIIHDYHSQWSVLVERRKGLRCMLFDTYHYVLPSQPSLPACPQTYPGWLDETLGVPADASRLSLTFPRRYARHYFRAVEEDSLRGVLGNAGKTIAARCAAAHVYTALRVEARMEDRRRRPASQYVVGAMLAEAHPGYRQPLPITMAGVFAGTVVMYENYNASGANDIANAILGNENDHRTFNRGSDAKAQQHALGIPSKVLAKEEEPVDSLLGKPRELSPVDASHGEEHPAPQTRGETDDFIGSKGSFLQSSLAVVKAERELTKPPENTPGKQKARESESPEKMSKLFKVGKSGKMREPEIIANKHPDQLEESNRSEHGGEDNDDSIESNFSPHGTLLNRQGSKETDPGLSDGNISSAKKESAVERDKPWLSMVGASTNLDEEGPILGRLKGAPLVMAEKAQGAPDLISGDLKMFDARHSPKAFWDAAKQKMVSQAAAVADKQKSGADRGLIDVLENKVANAVSDMSRLAAASLATGEMKSPSGGATIPPARGETKPATGSEAKSPIGGEAKPPTGGEAKSPTGGEAKYLTGEEAKSPTGGEAKPPTGGEAKSPSGGEARLPTKGESKAGRDVLAVTKVATPVKRNADPPTAGLAQPGNDMAEIDPPRLGIFLTADDLAKPGDDVAAGTPMKPGVDLVKPEDDMGARDAMRTHLPAAVTLADQPGVQVETRRYFVWRGQVMLMCRLKDLP